MNESKQVRSDKRKALGGLLAAALLALATPAGAFHFPWDQGHDTTQSNDPNAPGTDKRSTCVPCAIKSFFGSMFGGGGGSPALRSPAYAALGHAIWSNTDVALRGRPFMGVTRTYNSNDPVVGLFGNGWTVDFDVALYPANESGTQLRILKDANGKRFAYTKQADGSLLAPAGRFETIVEGTGTVTMTMLDGRRSVFALDGRLLQRIDINGNTINYSYDAALRPVRMSDASGRSLSFSYNASSLVGSVADHTGRTWSYAYDANGNLVSVTDPAGGVLRYTWQGYRPSGDANTYWQLLTVTDASGVAQVKFTYSGSQVASYTEGANTFTYTRPNTNTANAGTVTKRDATGVTTSFTYGALGLVTQDVDGIGGRTSYTYDSNGLLTSTVDALGRTWTSAVDSLGRTTSATNPLAQTTTIAYSGSDPRPVRTTSPTGRVVALSYDGRGNLLTTTDPAGSVTTMAYSAEGDVTSVTNALAQTTNIVYTTSGLPIQVTDPLGRASTMAYDALGRVTAATNAAGESTAYAYDTLDRITSVTDPMGQVTAFTYDAADRLTSVTDAKGSTTQYQYDSFGRRTAEIAPDGRRTGYAYRLDNRLQTITWPDNTTITYGYDNNKRVTSEVAGGQTISYTYNAVNQLLTATGPGGVVSYTYDNAGRVATETSGGKTNVITRNAEGERVGLAFLGQTQTYTRDVRGLVTQINNSAAGSFGFAFDALGRRTQLSYPNGSTASYAYDAAGQLTNLTHAGVFNAPYVHTYDAAGRITKTTGDGPDWNYSYDALGRLTQATQGSDTYTYTLDPVGNILDGGRTHDVNHRLVSDANKTYSYDLRGNLTLEQDRVTGARTVYTWNSKNQLVKLQSYDSGTTTVASQTLNYLYDPLGRRASKQDDLRLNRYVYDSNDLVGMLDGGSNVTAQNVFSGVIDEPLATFADGSVKTLHTDHLGSVIAVIEYALLAEKFRYGPYGETLIGSSLGSLPFRYVGREKDADSTYYYRSRYYSTAQMRFIQSDSIGMLGGVNSYAYVSGDPISQIDPLGLLDRLVFDGTHLTGYDDMAVEFQVPAVSGPWGKGRLPEGVYNGKNLRSRNEKGNKGMQCDGKGWSLDLEPTFKTTRDLLRIHPDGNKPGTKGCIGPSCAVQQTVHDALSDYFSQGGDSIPVVVKYSK